MIKQPSITEGLKSARAMSGMTQDEAAKAIGIQRNTYAIRERNPQLFKFGDLQKLYKALNDPGRQVFKQIFGIFF